LSQSSVAGNVEIVKAKASLRSAGIFSFSVTLKHGDMGLKHFADAWEVVAPDGKVLGARTLLHPHEHEEPLTRGLSGVKIPVGINKVLIRAHDKVHGTPPNTFEVTVPGR
jgi:hypothetical protein